jgi:1,2-diacylglycerol 3-alpha-glucosyltransferase
MKILIASDLHWPTLNGVATFSRNLAQGLASRGHEVLVIAPSQTGKKYEEWDGNYLIKRTRAVAFPFYQKFRISLTPQLEVHKIIDEFQPDVVHVQMLMWIGQATMAYARKKHIPVVSTSHAMPENLMDNITSLAAIAEPINYVLRDYGRRFHSRADCITTPTESAIRVFGKHSEKLNKPIEVVSNGIDLERFQPGKVASELYKRLDIPENKQIVTYIGRLDAEKHLSVLVKAFARVREHIDAHLVLVGGGTDLENLIDLTHKLNIAANVTFTGRVNDEDLVQLHRIGQMYCIASPMELQSIATLEAMASGQPIVAVDAGALAELCHDGENGFLYPLDDDEKMAEGITKILADPMLRAKFSKESMAIARTHDLTHTLERFEEIYRQVIKRKADELAQID